MMDHRPWLILSRAEATALAFAASWWLESRPPAEHIPAALRRALRMVDAQVKWIDGEGGLQPDSERAVAREKENSDD